LIVGRIQGHGTSPWRTSPAEIRSERADLGAIARVGNILLE